MDLTGIDCLGLDRVLRRGTGEILEERSGALLIADSVSGAYMLACADAETGLSLLDRQMGDCRLLMVSDLSLGRAAFDRYGFSDMLECFQVAYFGPPPPADLRLTVREAEEGDLPLLMKNYDLVSPEEMALIVAKGSLLLGYEGDRPVGFVGEHLEGSMGLLYVFPEFRRRGFASALERSMIARTMAQGYVPFGQVEKDNLASLRLQEKLGLTMSDDLIWWMWR